MDTTLQKRLVQTAIALLVVLMAGTAGYYLISGREEDLFTCFYMTVVTITTIGFGEIIDLKKYSGGREFTVCLAFAGIGVLTYFVSTVSAIIIEGHLRESYKKRKMEKLISKMKEHYIICGISKHSFHLMEELSTTKRQSVFIEIDKEIISQITKKFAHEYYIEGDATNDENLIKAGIKTAKGLFAATNDDNLNLVICLSARRLNPELKIVSLCLGNQNAEKLKMAGANTIVSPNFIGGLRMASEMFRPTVTDFLDSMLRDKNKNLRLEQIDIEEKFNGKKISELGLDNYKDTLLIALKSNGEWVFKPDGEYEIKNGDSLIVMTTPEEREKLEQFNE